MSKINREMRKRRIRAKVSGTPDRPRACVYRSRRGVQVQLIDDTSGQTLLAARSHKEGGNTVAAAQDLGKHVAKAATEKGINKAVFDRGGFLYHGRVKAVADGLREGGLKL